MADVQKKIAQGLKRSPPTRAACAPAPADLQWRGVMSVADGEIAKEVNVLPEHRVAVNTIVTEYQASSGDDAAGNAGDARTTPGIRKCQTQPVTPMQRGRTLHRDGARRHCARKEGDEKALKLLSPEEKTAGPPRSVVSSRPDDLKAASADRPAEESVRMNTPLSLLAGVLVSTEE